MGKCRKIRPLLAASAYEPLDAPEQRALDAHLAVCARCRAELAANQRLARLVPADRVSLGRDLAPALLARLEERAAARPRLWMPRFAVAASVLLCCAAGWYLYQVVDSDVPQSNPTHFAANTGAVPAPAHGGTTYAERETPVACALRDAETQLARHAYPEAERVLREALASYPGDEFAGQAQLRLADLEYGALRHYDRAYESYVKLRNLYPDVFMADPRNADRFDLLVEGWADRFEPLYALDIARESDEDALPRLEAIMAGHPGKLVAMEALNEMGRQMARRAPDAGGNEVALLERVRAACSNPVAVAQVNLRLGDACAHRADSVERARTYYEDALKSGSVELTQQAREALARLDTR